MTELSVEESEAIYAQLIEHFTDRYGYPDAVNRATTILAKYYLDVKDDV